MKARLDKFWLWLYRYAGRRVGPEVDGYWDQHWWRVVSYRMQQVAQSDLGLNMLRFILLGNEGEAADGQGRDYRTVGREIRDTRHSNFRENA